MKTFLVGLVAGIMISQFMMHSTAAPAQAADEGNRPLIQIPDFALVDRDQGLAAMNSVVEAYGQIINPLLTQLQQSGSAQRKTFACYLLGLIASQDQRMLPALIDNIDLVAPWSYPKDNTGWPPHVDQFALWMLGPTGASYCLQRFATEPVESRQKLMCEDILDVYGKRISRQLVQDAIDDSGSESAKGILRGCLERYF